MGRITLKIKVENLEDILRAERGQLAPEQVRSVQVDALVDTGATLLCLPANAIAGLGLSLLSTRKITTANGPVEIRLFRGARLTIFNRTCTVDVMELQNGVPALIGYVPLEVLDLTLDLKRHAVVPNPEHGDEIVLDLFPCMACHEGGFAPALAGAERRL
ncbi:MAG: aspartyl protease [Planctomycetes bacterium]|nr:aspartyl protease [Planctomycetota bacterium]MBM4080692.1 aspartyl protease [Planctomycetota bacterium]